MHLVGMLLIASYSCDFASSIFAFPLFLFLRAGLLFFFAFSDLLFPKQTKTSCNNSSNGHYSLTISVVYFLIHKRSTLCSTDCILQTYCRALVFLPLLKFKAHSWNQFISFLFSFRFLVCRFFFDKL